MSRSRIPKSAEAAKAGPRRVAKREPESVLPAQLERYLQQLAPPRAQLVREMERLGDQLGFPYIGPLVGKLLAQLVMLSGARAAFELGSGFGYSAVWIARALPPDGRIYLTDRSPENLERARGFLERSGDHDKAVYLQGDALELFEQHATESLDFVLCDLDKERYPQAYDAALAKLKVGGLLVTDNVLWKGRVALRAIKDPTTAAIREFNRKSQADPDAITTILPLRDGVAVTLKLR